MSKTQFLSLLAFATFAVIILVGALAPRPQQDQPAQEIPIEQIIEAKVKAAFAAAQPPALPPPPAAPTVVLAPEKPDESAPEIHRVQINGQDWADLLGVQLWKFQFHIPHDHYTAYVWAEYWTQESDVPQVELLSTGSAEWESGSIVLKLPTASDPLLYIRVGENEIRNPKGEPLPTSWVAMEKQPLGVDKPIHLVTLTEGSANGDMPAELKDIHGNFAKTVYIKTGFTRGQFVAFNEQRWVPNAAPSLEPAN